MSLIRFLLHSKQFKKEKGFETNFPYHFFPLKTGPHLGRHLGYIEMLNYARVASLGFFKDNVCTTRINKEKKIKIKFKAFLNSPKFCRTKINNTVIDLHLEIICYNLNLDLVNINA